MAILTELKDLPPRDQVTAQRITQFGLTWKYVPEYQLRRLVQHNGHNPVMLDDGHAADYLKYHRLQIRDAVHYTPPGMVATLREAARNGEPFSAGVVTVDDMIIDGNTRALALLLNGARVMPMFVLDQEWQGKDSPHQSHLQYRMHTLGMKLNDVHGNRLSREEKRAGIIFGLRHGAKQDELARQHNVRRSQITNLEYELRAEDRAARLGHPIPDLGASKKRVLGMADLHDDLWLHLVKLAEQANLPSVDIQALVNNLREVSNDAEGIKLIERERTARRAQIAEWAAKGQGKAPLDGQLRQHLGFLLKHEGEPDRLICRNPSTVTKHRSDVARSIRLLTLVQEYQERHIADDPGLFGDLEGL